MAKVRVNKLSPVPLYRQLIDSMAEQISRGELRPGDRILSERELAEAARVSRTTARIAIDEMVATGLVYREQGRGTFVAEPHMRNLMGFASFTQDMIERGMQPGSVILEQSKLVADDCLAARLKVAVGDPVIRLVRLRLANREPVALQYSHLPYALMPGLETIDLTDKSLFQVLREEYGIYPSWTEAEVEAVTAGGDVAQHLRIHEGAPVLLVRGLTFTESFEIVESVETHYHGRSFALYIGRQRFSAGKA